MSSLRQGPATSLSPCSRRSKGCMQRVRAPNPSFYLCHATQKPEGPLPATSVHVDPQQRPSVSRHQITWPLTSRRDLIASGAATYLATQAASLAAPYAAAAVVDPATTSSISSSSSSLPLVPRAQLAPGLSCSRVIKGCWQLSGGHTGESQTDRTSGQAAVEVSHCDVMKRWSNMQPLAAVESRY